MMKLRTMRKILLQFHQFLNQTEQEVLPQFSNHNPCCKQNVSEELYGKLILLPGKFLSLVISIFHDLIFLILLPRMGFMKDLGKLPFRLVDLGL